MNTRELNPPVLQAEKGEKIIVLISREDVEELGGEEKRRREEERRGE